MDTSFFYGYDIRFKTPDEVIGIEIKLTKKAISLVLKAELLKGFLKQKELSKLMLIIFSYSEFLKIKPSVFGIKIDFIVEEFQDEDLKLNPNIRKYSIKYKEISKILIIIWRKITPYNKYHLFIIQ